MRSGNGTGCSTQTCLSSLVIPSVLLKPGRTAPVLSLRVPRPGTRPWRSEKKRNSPLFLNMRRNIMNYSKRIKECENSAINAWAEGRAVTKAGPWLVYIGTTNVCNNRCVVCAHHTSMRQERGFMGFETFKRIADQLPASVKKVYLMKQGEPFANKQLETFSEYLNKKRPDIHICIHTNGILMKKERLAKLLPHIHSLGVSISAISASVYEKVHGTRSFDKVVENLKGVSDLLQSLEKGKRPHVFVDYVRQSGNDVEKEAEVVAFHRERFPGIAS